MLKNFGRNGRDRPGEIPGLGGSVTDNDGFLQELGVFGEGKIGGPHAGGAYHNGNGLGFVTQVGNLQGHIARLEVSDAVVSVQIGGGSGTAAFDRDIGADNGLIAFVHDAAGNAAGTLACAQLRNPQQQDQQKGLSNKARAFGVFHGLV